MRYKKKTQWGLLKEAMVGKHSKRFNSILHTCDDIEFAKNFIKLLEFVQPKLARAEVSNDAEDQLITIVHVHSNPEVK